MLSEPPLKPLGGKIPLGAVPLGGGLPALNTAMLGGLPPPTKPLGSLGGVKTPQKAISPLGPRTKSFSPLDKPKLQSVKKETAPAPDEATITDIQGGTAVEVPPLRPPRILLSQPSH